MGTKQISHTLTMNSSFTSSQSFNKLDISHFSNKSKDQIHKIYQQKIVTILDDISYQEQMHIYQLRKQQEFNLVKVYSVETLPQKEKNLGYRQLKVLTQKIVMTLNQMKNITFEMGLSILYSASLGFQCLYKYLGYFEINDHLVGLNVNKQIRVWVNKEWEKNEKMHQDKRQPFGNIQDIMVRKLIQIISIHIEQGKSLIYFETFRNKFDSWSFILLSNFIIKLAFQQRITLHKTIHFLLKKQVKSPKHILNFKQRNNSLYPQSLNVSVENMYTSLRRNNDSIPLINSTKFKQNIKESKHIIQNTSISPINRNNRIKSSFTKSKQDARMLCSASFTNNVSNISFVNKNNRNTKPFKSKRQSQNLFQQPQNSYKNIKRTSVNDVSRQMKNLIVSNNQKIDLASFRNNRQNQNHSLQNIREELRLFLGSYPNEDLMTTCHHFRNKTVVQQSQQFPKLLQFQNKQKQRKRNKKLNITQETEHHSYINFSKKQNFNLFKGHQIVIVQPNFEQNYLGLQSCYPSVDALSPLANNANEQNKSIEYFLRSTVPNLKTIDQSICAKTASRDGKSNITLTSKVKELKQSFIISGSSGENNEYKVLKQGFARLNNLKIKNTLTQSINIRSSNLLQSKSRQNGSKKPLSMLDLMIIKRNLIKEKKNEQQLDISVQINEDSGRKSKSKVMQQDD